MSRRPLIIADENIPAVESVFGSCAELQLLPGRSISPAAVRDADALLVRSVTRVDQRLLAGSRVRFVGSATAGVDHIDEPWLEQQGIDFAAAPGCNADAVVEYVLSALSRLDGVWERLLAGGSVGIVGLGQVGGRLYRRLSALGVRCLGSDPLLAPGSYPHLTSLEAVLNCDVISLHTPLTRNGPHATYHLLDAARLAALRPDAVLINAARGPVVDNAALREQLTLGRGQRAVLDVWEGEPEPDAALLAQTSIATAHIAGYSWDGKLRGTATVWRAWCRHAGLPESDPPLPAVPAPIIELRPEQARAALIRQAVLGCYDIRRDDRALRQAWGEAGDRGAAFDRLRRDYHRRREFAACELRTATLDSAAFNDLRALGFAC